MPTQTALTNTYRSLARLLFVVTLACVLLLALSPVQRLQEFGLDLGFSNDKVNHLVAFASLAFIGYFGWPTHKRRLTASLIVLGILIELFQALPQTARDPELLDWIADCIGLVCGLAVALGMQSLSSRWLG